MVALLTFILLLCVASAQAQFDTGTISGQVTDSSGATVPNANVKVTNTGTGDEKTVSTDQTGMFIVHALPFGTYVISASSTGFSPAKSQPISLSVGASVNVKLALTVAGSEQVVEVTGTSTTVETTSSTAGTTLNSTQISSLPVNGRDVNNFLNIAPGSVNSTGYFQGSVNGLENVFTGLNISVDGQTSTRGDISGFLATEGQEGARVTRASVESVQEIDFANNGYTAEKGRSLGPQMNIVTKSGTNDFHGTAFEYLRNDALDARDYFDHADKKNPLRLNQFGGNLSGAIIRNKLFFFANYEGARTHMTSLNSLYETLSASARAQFVPSMQPLVAALPSLPAGCSAIPTPDNCAVPNTNGNLVYLSAALPTITREDTGSIRLDYNATDNDRIMFRYNVSDSLTNQTFGLNAGQVAPQALRVQLAKIDETHTFSSTLLNQFSVAVNRFRSDTNSNTGDPLVGFSGFFTNLGALPGPNSFNQINANTMFEVFDSLTKVAGAHSLKIGADIRANRLNTWLRPQQTYQYASFSDLFNNQPFVLSKIGFPGFLGIRDSNWGFYVQDDWRVSRRLTLNLGLRYDYNTPWAEMHNRQQNFDVATQKFLPTSQPAYEAPGKDFQPRVGLAWDVFGNGKTALHAYGGMFNMPMQLGMGLATNIPEYSNYNATVFDALFGGYSINYPSPNPPSPPQNVTIFPRHPRDPMSTNWLVGVDQQLAPNTVLTVNYTGNKTAHMQAGVSFAALNLNPQNAFTGARQNYSGFANENYEADILSSKYNALQLQLRHHRGPLQVEANYSYGFEHDNLVNVFSSFSNPFDPNEDWSVGDIDVRHNLTASFVYSLPELKNQGLLMRGVFGGWQTSSIFQVRSGLPVNISLISGFFGNPVRPAAVSGQPTMVSDPSWPTSSYNAAAYTVPASYDGSWGPHPDSIERNSGRGPAFFQWDFSLAKNFSVTERLKLQFRAELFNILNHPNFANPDGGICLAVAADGTCTPNPNFGVVSSTVASQAGGLIGNGTSRQAQLSLRLMF